MGKRFTMGAIIGIAVGVVAGVLTAPKSGRETRNDIKQKANSIKDQATDIVVDVKDKALQTADELKSAAGEYVGFGEEETKKKTDAHQKKRGFFDRFKE